MVTECNLFFPYSFVAAAKALLRFQVDFTDPLDAPSSLIDYPSLTHNP